MKNLVHLTYFLGLEISRLKEVFVSINESMPKICFLLLVLLMQNLLTHLCLMSNLAWMMALTYVIHHCSRDFLVVSSV